DAGRLGHQRVADDQDGGGRDELGAAAAGAKRAWSFHGGGWYWSAGSAVPPAPGRGVRIGRRDAGDERVAGVARKRLAARQKVLARGAHQRLAVFVGGGELSALGRGALDREGGGLLERVLARRRRLATARAAERGE